MQQLNLIVGLSMQECVASLSAILNSDPHVEHEFNIYNVHRVAFKIVLQDPTGSWAKVCGDIAYQAYKECEINLYFVPVDENRFLAWALLLELIYATSDILNPQRDDAKVARDLFGKVFWRVQQLA